MEEFVCRPTDQRSLAAPNVHLPRDTCVLSPRVLLSDCVVSGFVNFRRASVTIASGQLVRSNSIITDHAINPF